MHNGARAFVLVYFSCFLVFPTAAEAQPATSEDQARTFFEEGREAYAEGRFMVAAHAFRRAYLLSGRAELLYNVGQAELRADHDSLALEAFEGYLRRSTDENETRAEVEERVRVLRSMGVTPATESEVAEAARMARGERARSSGGSSSDPAPWIVFGVGIAAIIPGPILLGVAADQASRVTNAEDGATWRGDLENVARDAEAMWAAGFVVLGVGVAVATAGIIWAVSVGGSSSEQAELRLTPTGLALAGTFR